MLVAAGEFGKAAITQWGTAAAKAVEERLRNVRARQARNEAAVVQLDPDLPDEARLELLDLDLTSPEVWGRMLVWDRERAEWTRVPLPRRRWWRRQHDYTNETRPVRTVWDQEREVETPLSRFQQQRQHPGELVWDPERNVWTTPPQRRRWRWRRH